MRTITLSRDELHDLAADVLGQGAFLVFAARGGSMLPFIREGDLLTVAPLGHSPLRLGEIALYRCHGGALLAHRVIGRAHDPELLLIRGDASWGEVEQVRPEQLLGRVVALERLGRTRRLDTLWRRRAARLWHGLWPWSLRGYALAARLKRRLARKRRAVGSRADEA